MFDDALVESRKTQTPGGRRFSLPVAIGLHAAVIGVFVGASAWSTSEPELPERAIIDVVPGPLPAPRVGGEARSQAHPRVATAEPRIRIPSPDPPPIEAPTDEPSRTQDAGSDATAPAGPGRFEGVEGATGPLDGVGGGDGTGGGRNGPGGDGEEILIPGGDVRAPVLLERVEPDYPESARRARLQGTVILEATITAAGEVREIRLLKSVNPLLDEAAMRAVRAWRYRAATLNGRAVPVYLTVTVRFGIDG